LHIQSVRSVPNQCSFSFALFPFQGRTVVPFLWTLFPVLLHPCLFPPPARRILVSSRIAVFNLFPSPPSLMGPVWPWLLLHHTLCGTATLDPTRARTVCLFDVGQDSRRQPAPPPTLPPPPQTTRALKWPSNSGLTPPNFTRWLIDRRLKRGPKLILSLDGNLKRPLSSSFLSFSNVQRTFPPPPLPTSDFIAKHGRGCLNLMLTLFSSFPFLVVWNYLSLSRAPSSQFLGPHHVSGYPLHRRAFV